MIVPRRACTTLAWGKCFENWLVLHLVRVFVLLHWVILWIISMPLKSALQGREVANCRWFVQVCTIYVIGMCAVYARPLWYPIQKHLPHLFVGVGSEIDL